MGEVRADCDPCFVDVWLASECRDGDQRNQVDDLLQLASLLDKRKCDEPNIIVRGNACSGLEIPKYRLAIHFEGGREPLLELLAQVRSLVARPTRRGNAEIVSRGLIFARATSQPGMTTCRTGLRAPSQRRDRCGDGKAGSWMGPRKSSKLRIFQETYLATGLDVTRFR